jgi:hypothetical protein
VNVGDDLGRVHERGLRCGVRSQVVDLARKDEQAGEGLLSGLASQE